MDVQPRPVVVGVDGSEATAAALRYGLTEAARRGARLRLVHVVPDNLPVSPVMPVLRDDLAEIGAAILAEAQAQAHAAAPDVPVEVWLHHGGRSVELARAAEHADQLVVGRDERPLLERLLRGNTSTGVAARAAVPTVAVPAGWEPAERGTVLVGVKSTAHLDALLGDALAVAAERGSRVVLLHAWSLPTEYDDRVQGRVAHAEWARRTAADLEPHLQAWRATYPEVEVEIRSVHEHPVPALITASAEADLLVLVRRAHGMPAAVQLGGTARSVIRAAHCPVRVVPPQLTVGSADRDPLEAAAPAPRSVRLDP
ncbi:MAG: universal stress protein [Nocardioides sp.]